MRAALTLLACAALAGCNALGDRVAEAESVVDATPVEVAAVDPTIAPASDTADDTTPAAASADPAPRRGLFGGLFGGGDSRAAETEVAAVDPAAAAAAAQPAGLALEDGPVVPLDGLTEEAIDAETTEAPSRRRGLFGGLFSGGGGDNRPGPSARDFIGEDVAVTPGLASCVTVIGRPDLASDPNAPMTNAEILDLLECTSSRAMD